MNLNLDMDCLRTFVSIVALGSRAKAADAVGRSLPAISLQIDRLEEQLGHKLFRKEGRRMVLSVHGEEFLGYANSVLVANDDAVRAFQRDTFDGEVRFGVIQDFAEHSIPRILSAFTHQYPNARVDVLVERSKVLVSEVEAGRLDHAICFEQNTNLRSKIIGSSPMIWIGSKADSPLHHRPLRLVLIEGQCTFRDAALNSLSEAGMPYQITLTSPSLSCLAAAVEAGIGITTRTPQILTSRWTGIKKLIGLPKLPNTKLIFYSNTTIINPTAEKFLELCNKELRPEY